MERKFVEGKQGHRLGTQVRCSHLLMVIALVGLVVLMPMAGELDKRTEAAVGGEEPTFETQT